MARSMAQMQQLLNSMTPEQRAQLQELANSLLDDMDLRWQVDQLGQNLRNAFPQMGWGQRMRFRGDEPMPLGQMSSAARPARRHRRAREPAAQRDEPRPARRGRPRPGARPARRRRRALTRTSSRSSRKELEEAGLIEQREGRMELTPKGIRRIGQRALGDLFRRLLQDRAGRHEIERSGLGHERADEHKPYEFGDPFHLDVGRTIKNAITRQGAGTPVRIRPDDFEIERTEQVTRTRDRADARRLALDGDARPVPRGQEGRDGAARADHVAVPARLPRHGQLRPGRPRGEARAAARSDVGLRVGHEHAARDGAGPQACSRARPAASRSS